MKGIVTICGHAVGRLEYKNQTVMTLAMIDKLHDKSPGQSKLQFWRNREIFIEGVDYFDVPYSEWKPLLDKQKALIHTPKKSALVVSKRYHQDDESDGLKSREIGLQTEEENLDFSFPSQPKPAASSAAEMPVAKITRSKSKQSHPELKLEETKKPGGHRNNMFFIASSGYKQMITLFNDPQAKEMQRRMNRYWA